MDRTRLIRTFSFRATHHYGRPEWDEARNVEVFGPQVEPHQHEWRVEIVLAGPIDPATGWVVDLQSVDASMERLMGSWRDGDINAVVPEVMSGEMQPSTENLARWIFRRLAPTLPTAIRLREVRVFEGPDLGASYAVEPNA